MFTSLWIAKTGLDAQQLNMNVVANNLANANTNGFKRSRTMFEDLMYQNIRSPGEISSQNSSFPSNLQIGTGVKPISTEIIDTQGNLTPTNSFKDLAIDGIGFFQIVLPNGKLAYTRDGAFNINQDSQLVNHSGFPVQQESGIIFPNNLVDDPTIGLDGSVTVKTSSGENSTPEHIGQINLFHFSNTSGLSSIGNNLFIETSSSGPAIESKPGTEGTGNIKSHFLESSNVNIAEELVNLIQIQRAYEINGKAISSADQMLQKLSQL